MAMPKISEERKTERREQILAAARRCFAERGYEGATVAKLEEATGLSRGAIFNYFSSKDELFIELARRDNERLIRLWLEKGWETALREVVEEDPDWIGVYFELTRKIRTDPGFNRLQQTAMAELVPVLIEHIRDEQAAGKLRGDAPAEHIAEFVSIVANGIAVRLAGGDAVGDVGTLVELVRTAVTTPG
jgi:AcrR family transcriptional regulator